MKKLLTTLGPLAGYIVVVVFIFFPVLTLQSDQLVYGDDVHRAYYFFREYFNHFLRQGIFPWWNPYNFSGTPFIADPVINIWYPPTWIFTLFPLNVAYSWHLALHVFWAMAGMYVLLRGIKRWGDGPPSPRLRVVEEVGGWGAWVGGLIFGLSGFFMARIWAGHVDVIAAASWMPWVVGGFWRLMHKELIRGRDIVLAAALFAMQLYAGYQTMAFFTVEIIGIVTLCMFISGSCPSAAPAPPTRGPRRLGLSPPSGHPLYLVMNIGTTVLRLSFAGFLGLGLAGFQLIPVQEFFRRSIRTFAMPYEWNSYGSLTLSDLWQLIKPFPFGDQVTYAGSPPNFAEHAFFVGRVGVGLAVIGFLLALRRVLPLGSPSATHKGTPAAGALAAIGSPVAVFAFGTIALYGLWMSLGPNAPIDLQKIGWHIVPTYKYLRIPPRHLILFVFGLSALAGIGFAWLRSLRLPRLLKSLTVGAIGGLVMLEMVTYARHFMKLEPIPETRHDRELISLASGDSRNQRFPDSGNLQLFRVLPNFGAWIPPRDSLDFDATSVYGIFSTTGYDPSILRNYYEFIDASIGATTPSIRLHDVQVPYVSVGSMYTNFLNIKYILHPTAYDPLYGVNSDRFVRIKEDARREYRLYENKEVLPRFYFVPSLTALPGRQAVVETIGKGTFDVSKTILVDETQYKKDLSIQPDCTDIQKNRVEMVSYTPNRIELSVRAPCNGYLASSEVMYPGWEATIDGKASRIFEGNLAFRTLYVPRGDHTILYEYRPTIFVIGGTVSLLSLALCVILIAKKSVF